MDLFAEGGLDADAPRPLADKLRPAELSQIVGQAHLLGPDAPITQMVASGRFSSVILWGPPGVGKTTLARLIAQQAALHFEQLSAIFSGVADLRRLFEEAAARRATGQGTLLFVDEIHRFNRAQQDSFLPHVESGLVTLIGATTQNPSFELNAALLSRAQVLCLKRLDEAALECLIERVEGGERPLGLTLEARAALIALADGDGRYLMNLAEDILNFAGEGEAVSLDVLQKITQRRAPIYDKAQEGHYNLISALHKSVRGSDPDAALYWFARMLVGGEDPLYLARRLERMASEDIGNADPQALGVCIAARQCFEHLGAPEGELALAQAVLYLATAPKSNAVYVAFKAAMRAAKSTGSLAPPAFALNAPTKLMEEMGYSEGYVYDHDAPDGFAGLDYFPPEMARAVYYDPPARGFEKDIQRRLEFWAKRRKK